MYVLDSLRARELMSRPFGIVIYDAAPTSVSKIVRVAASLGLKRVITVGDVVTREVLLHWRRPDVAIVDNRTARSRLVYTDDLKEMFDYVLHVRNPRSTLSIEAENAVRRGIKVAQSGHSVLIVVDGEEDLLAIPAILCAEPRSAVIYGIPQLNAINVVPVCIYYKLSCLKLYCMMRRAQIN